MSDMLAVIGCLRCGAELEAITIGRVICQREGSAILACSDCHYEHHLRVTLGPLYEQLDTSLLQKRRAAVCGTDSGYFRHRRLGERPCVSCTQAHAEADRARFRRRRVTA